jgi:4-alpha-glucanotransferase
MKYMNGTGKVSGFAVPLFSAWTEHGQSGTALVSREMRGEFPDIVSLGRLAQRWGMRIIQLLPLNDTGAQTSPYSALSAFALHPVYLRIEDLPEYVLTSGEVKKETAHATKKGKTAKKKEAERLAPLPDGVWTIDRICDPESFAKYYSHKLDIARNLWLVSGKDVEKEISAFSSAHRWVKPYSCFVELKRRNDQKPWWEWGEHRNPDAEAVEKLWNDPEFGRDCRFWAWLQLRCFEQCSAASHAVMKLGIDIIGDIPILMNFDSADVWFERDIFQNDYVAGAPPDMYSRLGQNWGFPLYKWDVLEEKGYSFWKNRLSYADNFYSSFRIDHVLGFFRIWAIDGHEEDGFIGRFVPQYGIAYPELAGMDFSPARVRWLSRPHVPLWAIEKAEGEAGYFDLVSRGLATEEQIRELRLRLFEQIGEEPLFLFSSAIRGGKDISDLVLEWSKDARIFEHDEVGVRRFIEEMKTRWRDRPLYEFEPGYFVPTWEYKSTTAWQSLDDREKSLIEALVGRRNAESQMLWEKTGKKTLSTLIEKVDMAACAEDLGAVPPCVPAVLGELGIPGLRVFRWTRDWDKGEAPYVPFAKYPESSVACTSVHDSTNLRQWWKEEADRTALWPMIREAAYSFVGHDNSSIDALPELAPNDLDPDMASVVLSAFCSVASRIVVFPIQDILAASGTFREDNPTDERINTPGTLNAQNWLYRMKISLDALLADETFSTRVQVATSRMADGRPYGER